MKENYQKTLKTSTLVFLSNPVPFNGQSYQKQKGRETSDQWLFTLRNKFRKFPLLVIYYLTKFEDVIKAVFDLHLQIYASQFTTSQIIPLPFVLLYLESVEKKGKMTKI